MNPTATKEVFEIIVNGLLRADKLDQEALDKSYAVYCMFMHRANTMPEMDGKIPVYRGIECFVKTILQASVDDI